MTTPPTAIEVEPKKLDSGLVCFIMICRFHNIPVEAEQIAHEYLSDGNPFDIQKMRLVAKNLGLKCKVGQFKNTQLGNTPFPAIARRPTGEFFIIARVDSDQCYIQNPIEKKSELWSLEELASRWTQELVLFTSRASILESLKRFDFTWFIPAVIKYRYLFMEALGVSLVIQTLALITPLFFQVIMDKVLVHQGWSTLNVITVGLAITTVFSVLLTSLRTYVFSHTTSRIDVELGSRLFRHLTQLPIGYFKSRRVGDSIARVRELENIRQFLTGNALTVVLDLLFSVIFIAVMFIYSKSLTAIVVLSIPLYVLISVFLTPPLRARLNEKFNRGAENQSFLVETLSGMETIKSMAIEPQTRREWDKQLSAYVVSSFRTANLGNVVNSLVTLVSKLVNVATLWWGAHLVISSKLTVGQFIAFNMLAGQVAQPILRLSQLWTDFQQIGISMQRLDDILSSPAENQTTSSRSQLPTLKGALTFENVTFRYRPGTTPVITNLNLHTKPFEMIGIVGRSGSGKSTIAKLIQRFYVPEQGRVLIDGIDLAIADVTSLRRQIGVVLQENILFNRSIRQNIALADPGAPIERVMAAAKVAGAHDFILEQPEAYDTIIQEQGSSLSGGQRQRIAIARALLTNPRILIFDEATSALDYESENVIHKHMNMIRQGRTVIVIAHRLSTVRKADRILVVDKGEIVEDGSHETLLQNPKGLYAYLHRLQHGEVES